jgi:hypothetical protein
MFRNLAGRSVTISRIQPVAFDFRIAIPIVMQEQTTQHYTPLSSNVRRLQCSQRTQSEYKRTLTPAGWTHSSAPQPRQPPARVPTTNRTVRRHPYANTHARTHTPAAVAEREEGSATSVPSRTNSAQGLSLPTARLRLTSNSLFRPQSRGGARRRLIIKMPGRRASFSDGGKRRRRQRPTARARRAQPAGCCEVARARARRAERPHIGILFPQPASLSITCRPTGCRSW